MDVSRRQILRLGFFGSLALSTISATALLTGCSKVPVASGFRVLRESDLKVLRALVPVALAGEIPAGEEGKAALQETLHTLDNFLAHTSLVGQKQLGQLFDLMHMPATRYTMVGLSDDWDEASAADIAAFLEHWRASRFETLRMGYMALTGMLNMMWYLQPRAWAAINYVPPRVVA
jgi:hypothetical protein